MTNRRAVLKRIEIHLPERELTNAELADRLGGWTAEEIREKTGISSRRIAAEGECASDLAVAAAEKMFAGGAVSPGDIDFLLLCTQSPDHFLPPTGCLVQDRLGLGTNCGSLDFNHGCSGYVYGLAMAKGLVEAGLAGNVLLLTAETYSKYLHPMDRGVATIFGDAAAATLITAVEGWEESVGPFVFGTDGAGAERLMVPAGAHRMPATDETKEERSDESGAVRSAEHLHMNGPEIFTFTLKAVPKAVHGLLGLAGLDKESIDYFVLHQANRFMLERLRRKLKIDEARFCIDMEDCGNTVSSTIPIALSRAMAKGKVGPGARVMLVGFGVGFSWAAGLIRIDGDGRGAG